MTPLFPLFSPVQIIWRNKLPANKQSKYHHVVAQKETELAERWGQNNDEDLRNLSLSSFCPHRSANLFPPCSAEACKFCLSFRFFNFVYFVFFVVPLSSSFGCGRRPRWVFRGSYLFVLMIRSICRGSNANGFFP